MSIPVMAKILSSALFGVFMAVLAVSCARADDGVLIAIDNYLVRSLASPPNEGIVHLESAAVAVQQALDSVQEMDLTAPIRTSIDLRRRIVLTLADLYEPGTPDTELVRLSRIVEASQILYNAEEYEMSSSVFAAINEVRDAFWESYGRPLSESALSDTLSNLGIQHQTGLVARRWFDDSDGTMQVIELRADPTTRELSWSSVRIASPWMRLPIDVDRLPTRVDTWSSQSELRILVDLSDLDPVDASAMVASISPMLRQHGLTITDYSEIVHACAERELVEEANGVFGSAASTSMSINTAPADDPEPADLIAPDVPSETEILDDSPVWQYSISCDQLEDYPLAGQFAVVDPIRNLLVLAFPVTAVPTRGTDFAQDIADLLAFWPPVFG